MKLKDQLFRTTQYLKYSDVFMVECDEDMERIESEIMSRVPRVDTFDVLRAIALQSDDDVDPQPPVTTHSSVSRQTSNDVYWNIRTATRQARQRQHLL